MDESWRAYPSGRRISIGNNPGGGTVVLPGDGAEVLLSEVNLVAAVLAGAASFLSPCVLPLIPGYISLMSGYSMQDLSEGNVSIRRVTGMTGLFVLGFTLVFVGLGATATSLSSFLSNPVFSIIADPSGDDAEHRIRQERRQRGCGCSQSDEYEGEAENEQAGHARDAPHRNVAFG